MNTKTKKILFGTLFGLDIALTIFLFIISIIMLATMPKNAVDLANASGFIGYLQKNPSVFLGTVVVPLFVLLAVNIGVLVWYVKKTSAPKKVELTDLSDDEKAKLKEELIKDLSNKDTK